MDLDPHNSCSGAPLISHALPSPSAFKFLKFTAAFSLRAALQDAVAREAKDCEGLDIEPSNLPCKRKADFSGCLLDEECSEGDSPSAADLSRPDRRTKASMHPETSLSTSADARLSIRASGRKAYKKRQKTAQRKAKQRKDFVQNTLAPSTADMGERLGAATAVPVDLSVNDLPTNSSGYEAKNPDSKDDSLLDMERLLAEGYVLIEWDGRKPLILEDSETKKIFFVGVPKPEDPSYDAACDAVANLLAKIGDNANGELLPNEYTHTRGNGFAAIRIGIGAGHGPPQPYNLRDDKHPSAAEALRRSPDLARLALHQSASFKFYMPKLYDYYHSHTMPVRNRLSDLIPNWERSIFCAAACNAGQQVATCFHRDCRNLAFGFCVVHAVGKYDFTKGGHIVLKEPKLIIQFPSGTHVLLPSATITHGNIPVQVGETRASFTQYTSGAMFRYVDNEFGTEKQLKRKSKAKYRKMLEDKAARWEIGLGLWSTVDELLKGTTALKAPGTA